MTLHLQKTLRERARERGDDLGNRVMGRLESCNDLAAEEAKYHTGCMTKFRLKTTSSTKRGRPIDEDMHEGFEKVCEWLENEGESGLYTITELHEKMNELNGSKEIYATKHLKQKLSDRYKEHIYFTELPGRADVICFRDMASLILTETKSKPLLAKNDFITAVANMIKADIRELEKTKEQYPNEEDITENGNEWIPESLRLFLTILTPSELKRQSTGQCITQASRPRTIICPLTLGLGIELKHAFGSKWLVNHLSRFGFCASYDEVLRFKESANETLDREQDVISSDVIEVEEQFVQWAADNVDHNNITLTGKGTFHGMGVISMSNIPVVTAMSIPRLKQRKKTADVVEKRGIELVNYLGNSNTGLSKLKFEPILQLKSPCILPIEINYDLLWHAGWFSRSSEKPRPNWSGYMHEVTRSFSLKEKSTISFLPIIDLDPNDETCIYSTLLFVIKQAKKLKIVVPSVTFDQPLWLKATGIIEKANLDIVCRLGGFHAMMSFLGSVGNLMKGSGIEEFFSEVYAEHTVTHMIAGKAESRALRAHFLTESTLTTILINMLVEEEGITMLSFEPLFEEIISGNADADKVNYIMESPDLLLLSEKLNNLKEKLSAQSRTARLWVLYLDYISVLKQFILAERTSNWLLHLESTKNMLNLFAATGHLNYAKSARFYLQQMLSLPQTHPWLYNQFFKGLHTARRNTSFWSGLWTDLTIEQTMMRSIKSRGGLTRGRGMSENVRHLWVLSLNTVTSVHQAMTQLS